MATAHQIVGVDGSPGSASALAWAAANTERFGPIRPVVAWRYPWWAVDAIGPGPIAVPPTDDELHAEAARRAEDILAAVPENDRLDLLTVRGPPGPGLVSAVEPSTTLLVVGTRGRGSVTAGILGSVSHHCAHHATVPVAIIPLDAPTETPVGRCVVGIDGSKNATAALNWALASTGDATIQIVHAWDLGTYTIAEVAVLAAERVETMAQELVDHTVASILERGEYDDRVIEMAVVRGDARRELRAAAEKADLLVVGARGHEGIAHLLVGSVTSALISQPDVPTVVVR